MKRFIAATLVSICSIAAFGSTTLPVQLLNPIGSSSGQVIASTGTSTAPAWANVSATALASQAANTVVANVAASSASPTAFAMPSCSSSSSALQYTSGTGFTCYTNSASLTGATFSGAVTIPIGTINNATIGSTTPSTGAFTTLSASGLITPSPTFGIAANTTGNNAATGSVGYILKSNASAVSLTSGTAANVCTLPLTAGDWDVQGVITTVPAASTTTSGVYASLNTTSATLGGPDATVQLSSAIPAGIGSRVATPVWQVLTVSPVTVYLVANVTFATSTLTANCSMRARRAQ